MRIYELCIPVVFLFAGVASAAPSIEVELATERGLQITAPQEWLQLLTRLGVENVRIRSVQTGDAPAVTNQGTAERPRYHVVGILTAREQLRLPGGTFGRGDTKRLKDYFDRLTADGNERLTAPEVHFGLTEKELSAVLADLAQPVDFETKGQPPRSVVERLQARFKHQIAIDAATDRTLREAKPVADELQRLSSGTGLAIMLRTYGLVLRPEKTRGQLVVYRVEAGGSPASVPTGGPPVATNDNRPGKIKDIHQKNWPIGWETEKAPAEIAPSLFEQLNAEIDGYTLKESLAAIGPRLKIPYYLDHSLLAAQRIEPAAVSIKLQRTQTSYKRLLDRVLAQAGLGCELRADEAGTVFLWISR
ncbi:MAG: hypothetical protein WD669_00990 [Pirellulales bacterium]